MAPRGHRGFHCVAPGEDGERCQPCATPPAWGLLAPVLGAVVHPQAAEHLHGCGDRGLEA